MKLLLLSLTLAGGCVAGGPELGQPAPPLTMEHILQAPADTHATWDRLKGTAVVIEFWATWCSGCRDQIRQLNQLVETFRNRPVRFISITDEEPELVQRFLTDYPISGWVGIDPHGKTFSAYNIDGRPQTVLVDAVGVLRAIGPPSQLNSSVMEDFLAGKAVTLGNNPAQHKLQTTPNRFFELMIRPAAPISVTGNSPGLQTRYGAGIAGWGMTVKRMASLAYDVPEQHIEAPEWCSKDLYDVAITYPGLSPDGQARQLRQALELTFQLNARKQAREMDAYEVRPLQGVRPKLVPSTGTSSSRWGNDGDLKYIGVTAASVAGTAERVLNIPVFDETGLIARFDFDLKWDAANPESLIAAIRNQLGLNLVKTRRSREYLVVDSAVRPSAW
jgi:uncharacterized protein (TIGR03435 family)